MGCCPLPTTRLLLPMGGGGGDLRVSAGQSLSRFQTAWTCAAWEQNRSLRTQDSARELRDTGTELERVGQGQGRGHLCL